MKYGYFSRDTNEYVITDPITPSPWMNYISNHTGYCGIISQAAGGFSFHKDPRDRRITKYRYNSVPIDRPGRYLYLKNEATGEYWSPSFQPVMKKLADFECRHGQGYTIISSKYSDIHQRVLYFVPENHTCEIWHLAATNNGKEPVNLSAYSYSEFTFWSEPQSRNIQWSLHLTRCYFRNEKIVYPFIEPHPAYEIKDNMNYNPERPGFAFMGLSLPVSDFDCRRDAFIGLYRSETNPAGVENRELSRSILEGGVPCATLRTRITLQPGEKKDLVIILGYAEQMKEADDMAAFFSDLQNVQKEFEAVKKSWTSYFSTFTVRCPDDDVTLTASVWNPYQCRTTFDWSRYISFYENGEGRGMGTRDSCQDTLAVCSHLPQQVRNRIIEITSACQFENGACFHQYFPLDKKGDLKGFSDDHLWLIVMTHAYIAETGDISILKESVPFAQSNAAAPLYDHLLAALKYTDEMRGAHGLPLILVADWNDTLHLWMEAEKPESVFIAELYVYACRLLSELAAARGNASDAERLLAKAAEMAGIINKTCWDGEWFLRGFGNIRIGTKENNYAKIFLNSQAWAIISGVAKEGRDTQCMDSVRKYLYTPEGVRLLWPPFDRYDNDHGLISRYVKGRKENGIFAHAHSWAIIAEAILGRPDTAYEYYLSMLPARKNDRADKLVTEPYIYCQTIGSEDSISKGEGANSWLTGTASWMYVAFTQYILGIKPALGGLRISPCIPRDWDGFSAERNFRECRYHITCRRTGRPGIFVNDAEIKDSIVPVQKSPECRVLVEI